MDFLGLISSHGYAILLAVTFADQFGTPIPAIAILLTAGALAGEGRLSLAGLLVAAIIGTVAADLVLYQGGRWRGGPMLRRLCSYALAPDSCVRKTETSFERLGWKALIVAKFLPGLAFLAAPVAGVLRMAFVPFLLFDTAGAFLYNLVVLGLGFLFHSQLDRVTGWFQALGGAAVPLVVGAIVVFCAWRIIEKRRIINALRARRLSPGELRARMALPNPPSIVDLRSAIAFRVTCQIVPGAIRLDPEELEQRSTTIPKDRDVVLYCTCPNETTSARVALALKKRGIDRVYPLEGGFEAWVAQGYPVERLVETSDHAAASN